ncbi:MAG: hypothetical protein IJU84_02975 [Clostridia bacterium]|nr:hypothetical protein [Clostridia bacterium]
MKFKKISFILVAVVVAFATMLFVYSAKLGPKSVTATKIFGGYAETDCDDCSSSEELSDSEESGKNVDPDISLRPKRSKGMRPRIGRRKPDGRFPVKPTEPNEK